MELIEIFKMFDIEYGNSFELINLEQDESGVNFISRTSSNNGISAKVKIVKNINPFNGNVLTVSLGGSVLETFIQTKPFYTGFHIFVLKPKREMSERELMYFCLCIRKNKYRYNYGRQANRTLRDLFIPLEVPEKFLKLKIGELSNKPASNKKFSLSDRKWGWFEYKDLFNVKIGKSIDLNKLEEVDEGVNYIGRTDENNAITTKVFNDGSFIIYDGGCIALPMVGHSTLKSSYQTKPFCVSQNVAILRPKDFSLNIYVASFLNTIIRKDIFRFAYGRTLSLERLKMLKIKLPVDKKGNPDWQFMEDYIKSLPYSASI